MMICRYTLNVKLIWFVMEKISFLCEVVLLEILQFASFAAANSSGLGLLSGSFSEEPPPLIGWLGLAGSAGSATTGGISLIDSDTEDKASSISPFLEYTNWVRVRSVLSPRRIARPTPASAVRGRAQMTIRRTNIVNGDEGQVHIPPSGRQDFLVGFSYVTVPNSRSIPQFARELNTKTRNAQKPEIWKINGMIMNDIYMINHWGSQEFTNPYRLLCIE